MIADVLAIGFQRNVMNNMGQTPLAITQQRLLLHGSDDDLDIMIAAMISVGCI